MFVFVMIFTYFAVPPELQRRALLYGVLGAIVMRAGMILAGVWLVSEFAWVLYVFGAFLVITGVKMLIFAEHEPDLEKNPLLRWLRRHLRITPSFHGESFFVRQNGILWATPMFLVLILIEASDVVFAVDSIPAIFAVTTDPFIVFTSNIFAIMGLRALYFLLADMADRFHLLKYGLALVLVFIGGKMLAAPWFHMPIQWSLAIVAGTILFRWGPAWPCRNPKWSRQEKQHEPSDRSSRRRRVASATPMAVSSASPSTARRRFRPPPRIPGWSRSTVRTTRCAPSPKPLRRPAR
jgi:tellurite resistance protein TerC